MHVQIISTKTVFELKVINKVHNISIKHLKQAQVEHFEPPLVQALINRTVLQFSAISAKYHVFSTLSTGHFIQVFTSQPN